MRSGFTIKQAMTYNMVSALIAYIGLILGIFIGDVSSAQGWVLSLTAGMFLYISLVDMVRLPLCEATGFAACVGNIVFEVVLELAYSRLSDGA